MLQNMVLHCIRVHDALCLRYGWYLPLQCTCGKQFSVEHALSCFHGGSPTIRHNELRDVTAELLSEVCHATMLVQNHLSWLEILVQMRTSYTNALQMR